MTQPRPVRGLTPWGRMMPLALLTLIAVLLAACGGGGKKDATTARIPTDPRRVPTATVPANLPTPIAALESGSAGPSASLPENYVVKSGDTLAAIAQSLGISTDDLARANPNIDARGLRIGQELRIPRPTPAPTPANVARGPATPIPTPRASAAPSASPASSGTPAPGRSPTPVASPASGTPRPSATPASAGSTYTVESGDTGCAIARKLGVSVTALAQANGLTIDGLAALRIGQVLQVPRATGEGPGC